jgi:hypothetical protein
MKLAEVIPTNQRFGLENDMCSCGRDRLWRRLHTVAFGQRSAAAAPCPRRRSRALRTALLAAWLILPVLLHTASSVRAERMAGDPAVLAQLLAETVDSELLRVEAVLLTAASGFETVRGPGVAPILSLPAADRLARGAAASLGLPVVLLDNRLAPLVNSAVPFGVPLRPPRRRSSRPMRWTAGVRWSA